MTLIWTPPDPLNNIAKTKSIYMTELQAAANAKRLEIAQSQLTFINQNIGQKFVLSAIEELKTVVNQLTIDFGYPLGVQDPNLLGRPYVPITKKYGKTVCHYPILNDLRIVLNKLIALETWNNPEHFSDPYHIEATLVGEGSSFDYYSPITKNVIGSSGVWNSDVYSLVQAANMTGYGATGYIHIVEDGTLLKTNKIICTQNSQLYYSNVWPGEDIAARNYDNRRVLSKTFTMLVPKQVAFEIRDIDYLFTGNESSTYPGLFGFYTRRYSTSLELIISGLGPTMTTYIRRYRYNKSQAGLDIIDINNIVNNKFNTGVITLPDTSLRTFTIYFRIINEIYAYSFNLEGVVIVSLDANISFDTITMLDMR